MAAALPYVAVALAGVSAAKQHSAGKAAERAAERNAAAERAATAEEARRLKDEQRKTEATARARAAASGLKTDGSQGIFLKDMKTEHAKELDWLKKSGTSRATAAKTEGTMAKSQATSSAIGTLGNAATSAYSSFGS